MESQIRTRASAGRMTGRGSTLRNLNPASFVATKSYMRIPHSSTTLGGGTYVPLQDNSTSHTAGRGKDEIGDLCGSGITRRANLDCDVWGGGRGEFGPRGNNVRPEFTDDLRARRDF